MSLTPMSFNLGSEPPVNNAASSSSLVPMSFNLGLEQN